MDTTRSDPIEYHATIPSSKRKALEALFFFNPGQGVALERIRRAVDLAGPPFIAEKEGNLWLALPLMATQCLFACDPASPGRPVGVALFGRPKPDLISIVHLAIDPAWTTDGTPDHVNLAHDMIAKIKSIAASIRGVDRVELPYRDGCFVTLRRRPNPGHPA